MFARPEIYLFCSYVKFAVVGVDVFSMYAPVVGEGRFTVVIHAVWPEVAMHIGNPRGDTARPIKANVPIVRLSVGVENGE